MQATGKWFVMDASFCLGDLLKLELHNYVDACSEIVDRAQKELIIEKALARIADAWSRFELSFTQYQVRAHPIYCVVTVHCRQRDVCTWAFEHDSHAVLVLQTRRHLHALTGELYLRASKQCAAAPVSVDAMLSRRRRACCRW